MRAASTRVHVAPPADDDKRAWTLATLLLIYEQRGTGAKRATLIQRGHFLPIKSSPRDMRSRRRRRRRHNLRNWTTARAVPESTPEPSFNNRALAPSPRREASPPSPPTPTAEPQRRIDGNSMWIGMLFPGRSRRGA